MKILIPGHHSRETLVLWQTKTPGMSRGFLLTDNVRCAPKELQPADIASIKVLKLVAFIETIFTELLVAH